jgi:hypothetical protein
MNEARNWASTLGAAVIVLFGPIIAFVMIIAAEMLTDLVPRLARLSSGRLPSAQWDGFCCAGSGAGSYVSVEEA